MNKLIANMLVKLTSEDDKVLLQASLESILPACDHIYILDTTDLGNMRSESGPLAFLVSLAAEKVTILHGEPDLCSKKGFAEARNTLLDHVEVGDYIFWVDSDEVHLTKQLLKLKESFVTPGTIDDIQMHFIHFTLGSNFYEKFEPRTTIVKKTEETKWVNKVHERLDHGAGNETRIVFFSSYTYHHYGYVRDQETIFQHWKQYAQLEGKEPIHLEHEYPDHNVLDHRKDSLIRYFGEYPSALPKDWVKSKMIDL